MVKTWTFQVLGLDKMDPGWLEALEAAYGSKQRQLLREHLYQLDNVLRNCGPDSVNPPLDKIWLWTRLVPFNRVKLVIVGNCPSATLPSPGLPFHPGEGNVVSHSTKNIFRMIQSLDPDKLTPIHEIPAEDQDFSLQGWLDQGVLLLNSVTTRKFGQSQHGHLCWLPVMRKLLDHLYDQRPSVLFMLVGRSVYDGNLCPYPGGFRQKDEQLPEDRQRVFLVRSPKNPAKHPTLAEGILKIKERYPSLDTDFGQLAMWTKPRSKPKSLE